jgi:glycine/D-amino acid oxidase-like deaminating enzyme
MPPKEPTRRELLAGIAVPAAAMLLKPSPLAADAKRGSAVVVGSGVFGAWSAWHLKKLGYSVTLVDAWGPGNAKASSGGESRVTRAAYGPDEIYTRWARESLPEWKALAARSGQALFHECGVLWLGKPTDERLKASHETLTRLAVPHQMLDRAEIGRRWPQMSLDGIEAGLFEPEGGALLARRAVAAVAAELEREGVRRVVARVRTPVAKGGRIEAIETDAGERIAADRFVFACGPWMGKLFPELVGGRLFVTRQEILFFAPPPGDARFTTKAFPIWMVGDFYGIPDLESRGFKLADDRHGSRIDPDTEERVPSPAAIAAAKAFLAERFPALAGAPLVEARICQYENSANGDLLIDRHPEARNAVLVGCGSGHGFKHGPSVGAFAARLADDLATTTDPRLTLASKATVQQRAVH